MTEKHRFIQFNKSCRYHSTKVLTLQIHSLILGIFKGIYLCNLQAESQPSKINAIPAILKNDKSMASDIMLLWGLHKVCEKF